MSGSPRRARPSRLAVAGAAILIAIVGGGGYGLWYLFFRAAGPAAVGLGELPLPSTSAAVAGPSGSLDGTWKVDTSIGSFGEFTSAFVGYRVEEQLASIGANTAVGRTPDVSGSLTLAGSRVTAADITADLTSLKSDDDRRDGQLRGRGLETGRFPTARFVLTQSIDLGSVPTNGNAIHVEATGDLTLHGQTKSMTVPLDAKLSGGVIAVTGSLPITFSDFGIVAPSSFIVLSIADHGSMELQLLFTHA